MPPFTMSPFKYKLWCFARDIFIWVFGIPPNVFLSHYDHIHIGKNVWMGPGVCIVAANHNKSDPSITETLADVYIGDNSWLGANVVIMPGIRLGENTIVGANSTVTKSFPEGHVTLVGSPAKPLGDKQDE